MPQAEALVIVISGDRRYALPRSQVRALSRESGARGPTLAELIGHTAASDERYTLAPVGAEPATVIHVQQADLCAQLPQLPLPAWVAVQAHPAVVGLVLDGAELLPLLDLVQLALATGY